jgi:hypothetical protein
LKNTLLTEKVIEDLQRRLVTIDAEDMKTLIEHSRDEAVRIALALASQPAPPMSEYFIDSKYKTPEELGNLIDDVLLAEGSYGEFGNAEKFDKDMFNEGAEGDLYGVEEGLEVDMPSSEEAAKLCGEWKTAYEVVTGVSWGSLPYDLQLKWKAYNCDGYV